MEDQPDAGASRRKYQYTPLRDPSSQIRFLEVASENPEQDDLIKCKLTIWEVETAPPYHAISYTWGPEQPTETITVDDGLAVVRKNCADVLRQLIFFKTCRYYWLDALCIDQASVEEKSAQVAMMGGIFHNAEHVLLCIGNLDDDGEYAIQAIRDQTRHDEPKPSDRKRHPSWNEHIWPVIVKYNSREPAGVPPNVDLTRFALSLAAISRRPYFERMWVVQEIYLAQDVSVCCGKARLPMLHLCVELAAAINMSRQVRNPQIWVEADAPIELQNALRSVEGEINRTCTFVLGDWISDWPEGNISFHLLISHLACLKCQDPRDKLYGALALIDWRGGPPLIPDYSRSPFSLALALSEMSRFEIMYLRALELLRNLEIDKDDPDVRLGIEVRQQNRTACLEVQTREPKSLVSGRKFKYAREAWQLTDHKCERRVAYNSENSRLIGSRRYDIIAPLETRPGDWITYALALPYDEERKPRHDGIVLRRVGSFYAFIGRAIEVVPGVCSMEHKMKSPYIRLEMNLDYEDFWVLAATHKQLSAKEIIGTGVCSQPFSSFATLYEEPTNKSDVSALVSTP